MATASFTIEITAEQLDSIEKKLDRLITETQHGFRAVLESTRVTPGLTPEQLAHLQSIYDRLQAITKTGIPQ